MTPWTLNVSLMPSILHYFSDVFYILMCCFNDAVDPLSPLSSSPLAFNFSQHQVNFQRVTRPNEVTPHYTTKVSQFRSFSYNIWLSNKQFRLICSRTDWLILFAVHGTLRILLRHHGSKASIFWLSAFLMTSSSKQHVCTLSINKCFTYGVYYCCLLYTSRCV